jgi:iron(III) transport system ATP-binding protein
VPGIGIEGVTRRFGDVTAVDQVDLAIKEGEFVTLLGPSGCGKTTTLRMVAGLEHNDGGRISIGERVVSDAAKRLFVPPDHRNIGMVFQSYAIWPHMTVFDNVAYPLRIRRRSAAEVKTKVDWALQLVEMSAFAERPAPQLSGGQQQRVAIARALVFEPEVLLLDEPLSNLDAKLRVQTGDEFRRLQRRLGITTLYVTHDQEEAMALSDRVVVMHSGRVLQQGSPEEIYRRPSNAQVAAFFGSPNLLEAEVVNAAPNGVGEHRLTVRGTGWEGTCRGSGAFASGDGVLVMIRPEDIRLDTGARDGGPTGERLIWQGRVIETIFRGARRWVAVDVDGRRFNVEAPSAQAVTPDQPVTLRAEVDEAWAIRPVAQG